LTVAAAEYDVLRSPISSTRLDVGYLPQRDAPEPGELVFREITASPGTRQEDLHAEDGKGRAAARTLGRPRAQSV
jgi:hypothetical protein